MTTIHMLATMLQGGAGGIHAYVSGLLHGMQEQTDISMRMIVSAGEEDLLAGCSGRRLPQRQGAVDWLRAQIYGLMHAHDLMHVPSYRRVPWARAHRCIATVHDLAPLHMPEKYGWARFRFLRDVVPVGLRRCRQLITPTRHTKDDLVERFAIDEQQISVVPNGIDHSHFNPGDPQASWQHCHERWPQLRPGYVLFTSRIEHPAKGHVRLLEAWSKLPNPPQLVFVGKDCERADVVWDAVRRSGLDVIGLGAVPWDMLPHLYRACSLFVFPSLYEGFGLPPLEAMACGAVVASSHRAALAETVGPAVELEPDDPSQMAGVMQQLLGESEDQRAERRQAGLAWAGRFSWRQAAAATAAIYRQLSMEDGR